MYQLFIIPKDVYYVQSSKEILSWEKTNVINPEVATVVLIMDSLALYSHRFFVVYKGKMQMQGGSGSCYNPCVKTFIYNEDPMDNSKMPPHMNKWTTFNSMVIFQMIANAKYELLQKMGIKRGRWNEDEESLPYWSWGCEGYYTLPGLLIGKLDLVGLGKLSPNEIKEVDGRGQLLLN